MPTLQELADFGQSVWIDTLSREMLDSGELQSLIAQGIRGVTANPTILEKAITGSSVYDEDIRRMAGAGESPQDIYEEIVFPDIRRAADLFLPVYQEHDSHDGFVSLEVNPHNAYDTEATVTEARYLFATLDRPNLMIKVPATPAGIPAIEQLLSEGHNINITLLFSLDYYQQVIEAFFSGLERFAHMGGDISRVASVASFFVSRVDSAVDKRLAEVGEEELGGHIAVANARMAYSLFRDHFSGERWQALATRGAHAQRLLWASTGTKNPKYSDTLYVDQLIGMDTVNTMPLATLQAFLDHGEVKPRLEYDLDDAQFKLARLRALGIDLDAITNQLLSDGVTIFAKSYDNLLHHIAEKSEQFLAEQRRAA